MFEAHNKHKAPVSVHGSNSVDHAGALVEQRGVAQLGVEMAVVEEVVLVALVALDALTQSE